MLQHSRGGTTSQNANGCGYSEDVSFTLNVVDVHGVVLTDGNDIDRKEIL